MAKKHAKGHGLAAREDNCGGEGGPGYDSSVYRRPPTLTHRLYGELAKDVERGAVPRGEYVPTSEVVLLIPPWQLTNMCLIPMRVFNIPPFLLCERWRRP